MCGLQLQGEPTNYGDGTQIDCPNCGLYRASGTFLAVLPTLDRRGRAAISHRLALRASGEGIPSVTSFDVEDAKVSPTLPGVREATSRLLLWIFQHSSSFGAIVDVANRQVTAFVGVESAEAVPLLLNSLEEDGLIDMWRRMGEAKVRLTSVGWQKAEGSASMSAARFRQTDWTRVDRTVDEVRLRLATAETEEQCQAIGLLCREILISAGQAVSAVDPSSPDGERPSETDAKALLEAFLSQRLQGSSTKVTRKYARAAWDLAVELQHKRTATAREAALCAEATAAAVNVVSILAADP